MSWKLVNYANSECKECHGAGGYEIIDEEPWGDTYVHVPKGWEYCDCIAERLDGISLIQYKPRNMIEELIEELGIEYDGEIPF